MSDFKSRRARPIWFGCLLLLCVLFFDRAAAVGIRAALLHSDDRIARVYAGGRHDAVLVTGGSVANALLNPVNLSDETNAGVFQIALHGMDALTQRALVADYLSLNAAPHLALVEVRPARSTLVRAPAFGLYASDNTEMSTLLDRERTTLLPWRSIFHLYRFNSPLLPKTIQNLVDFDDQETGPSNGRMTPAIGAAWRAHTPSEAVDSRQVAAFLDTLEILQHVGVKPIVIVAPLHPIARYQMRGVRRDILSRLPGGVVVCDFSGALEGDRFFEDPAHLNARGREAMAPILAALIRQQLDSLARQNLDGGVACGETTAGREQMR